MIEPLQSNDTLLADIRAWQDSTEQVRLWWLGQSGFLLQSHGEHFLFDPYLSDSLTRKYAQTDKPHIRMTAIAIDPAQLNMIDWVTSTHNHTDHLDADTLLPIFEASPSSKLLVPAANLEFALDRLKCDRERCIAVAVNQPFRCGQFKVTAIPAAHESLDQDPQGRFPYVGYVVTCGDFTVYHSGDTIRYEEHLDYLRPFDIDLAILPINGRAPERRVSGNLYGAEAAQLAHDMKARCVIPCHYDMFTFNTASPDEFVASCERLGQDYTILKCGEAWTWNGRKH